MSTVEVYYRNEEAATRYQNVSDARVAEGVLCIVHVLAGRDQGTMIPIDLISRIVSYEQEEE